MLIALLVALLLGADVEPKPKLTVVASVGWGQFNTGAETQANKHLVLRNPAELVLAVPEFAVLSEPKAVVEKRATESLAKLLKVKSIDWNKQMLVVVSGGQQPQTDYRVEVTALAVKDGTLTVSWKLHEPKGPAGDAITYPATVALVPKHKGKVVFEKSK